MTSQVENLENLSVVAEEEVTTQQVSLELSSCGELCLETPEAEVTTVTTIDVDFPV